MITPAYLQRMARYNHWQNDSIYTAASTLNDAQRRLDRGCFFKSIHATLSHILWADQLWMSRLSDWDGPGTDIDGSTNRYDDWHALVALRQVADARFIRWADAAEPADIDGDLTYTSTTGTTATRVRWICLVQVFNHQTHHRGQVHAMLTAAGCRPDDTDVPFMPESYL